MTEENNTIEVVSIKFRNRGKMYFFDPAGLSLREGDKVVVETAKGLELGSVIQKNHTIPAERAVQPLRPVVRTATEDDLRIEELCRRREREAYVIGKQKIAAHCLDMKLVDVECSFEGNKILFFFSSDGRVDFRELVKDLAGVFRTRIELRQIGVRDEARMLGGLGICGRPFCCGTFMEDFAPVSTKMAKTQSMSLNPAKISGCCGRLMCCLRYEQAAYEELVKNVPKNGAFVETPDGYGNVTQVNVLRQNVKVKLDGPGDDSFRTYDAEDVAAVPGGRPRDGSQPPHVLVLKPKKPKEPEEPEDTGWEMPERLIMTAAEREQAMTVRQEVSRHIGSRSRNRKEARPAEARDQAGKQQRSGKNRPQKQSGAPKPEQTAEKHAERPAAQSQKHHGHNRSGGKQKTKPQDKAPAASAPEQPQESGAPKPKKNRSRYYNRRKPKSGGEGGAPKQGEGA